MDSCSSSWSPKETSVCRCFKNSVLTRTGKRAHFTGILRSLHGLPVSFSCDIIVDCLQCLKIELKLRGSHVYGPEGCWDGWNFLKLSSRPCYLVWLFTFFVFVCFFIFILFYIYLLIYFWLIKDLDFGNFLFLMCIRLWVASLLYFFFFVIFFDWLIFKANIKNMCPYQSR